MHAPAHVPVGVGGGLLALARQAGVGEEHVDRAILGFGCGDQGPDVFFLPDIGGDGEPVDVTRDLSEALARGPEIGDHDAASAGVCKGARGRFADAARAAGDDTDLVLDVHVRFPPLILSGFVKSLVPRLLDCKPRDQIKHRRGQSCRAGERCRRAHQGVDLHGAAELVVLQD